MAISLNREGHSDGTIDLTENIATTKFYNEFWEPAIKELGIKIFQENGHFNKNQLDDVLIELSKLKEWSIEKLDGNNLEYMKSRIEHLEKVIPNAFDKDDTVLYIY